MTEVYNFSPGPAVMPREVLEQAQAEMLDWRGSGISVMEMSHRESNFMSIANQAEADLRELLSIPSNYKVLFLQGGAHMQFAMIPLNLLRGKSSMDYLDTGDWSAKAIQEAKRFGNVNVVASTKDTGYTTIPEQSTWACDPNAAFLHYTSNETIRGVQFKAIPDLGDVPLVADMSSDILSKPIDVSRFGLIYAGAQKNIGPAGITVVIVREDLIGHATPSTPSMLDYQIYADNESMYNTPPTYAWYLSGLVFKWLKRKGGLAAMAEFNELKAKVLYDVINASSFYICPVDERYRSTMNVPFTLANPELDKVFLTEAANEGLMSLKGHRSVGGMRASIYNAMSIEGVIALAQFMREFERQHG
ncbi:MAG: 3-phosphoserine/phosphohydroxythreonine transaminase [Thiofilum sp.]|uniref:3-phosphoserine/phosphohydroxythreonine transaminase n=1 Tax=Thiofilum sp. TaxID=2212733 RepID=UPI0025DE6BE8|nr:3-phosphoserine/phosphohydroxythreonine transaminase [Thiofilum sp.]MBK8454186.1 3-phosphoserine/phosphohydroxythreonine transaminase [Thiofilum sp.]